MNPWGEWVDVHAHLPADVPSLMRRFDVLLDRLGRIGMRHIVVSNVLFKVRGKVRRAPSRTDVLRAWERVRKWAEADPRRSVLGYICPATFTCAEVTRDARRFVADGAVGFKVWVMCRRGRRIFRSAFRAAEMAAELGVPVLYHSWYRASDIGIGELTPDHIAEIARAVPEARIIMAHAGGDFRRAMPAVASCPNVSADISGSRSYVGLLDECVRWLGAERVVFGTDLPCRVPWSQLAKLESSFLSADQLRRVRLENAVRMFGLKI